MDIIIVVESLASGSRVFSELLGGDVPTLAGKILALGSHCYIVKYIHYIPPYSIHNSPC